jgi:hypothetical protein
MAYNKDLPYNELALLPPSGNWESIGIYKKLSEVVGREILYKNIDLIAILSGT